ncbi:MAG: hypothetical protein DIZ80_06545 [endosymbiont of Galathealinum brachiosum]|uniref:Uncharacterized protein n=1 Tax=endosymbiont of Galathealinum brachiosum TaxID=2200906 RepID=A0A370DG32_9GAMM|nr:MAG: hypothetical protein DIZ80_06545 [endosymbiont of Galathealinum brachiosum]
MIKSIFIILLFMLSLSSQAETDNLSKVKAEVKKEKSWWQKRHDRTDLFYPHKAHMDVMEDEGDACMLCHPFSKNSIQDKKEHEKLNQINNEALEAICHDCHVEKITAPSECRLCHPDPSTVWPDDHNYNYTFFHAEDAQTNQQACTECHKQLSFCTDCHFKRNYSGGYSSTKVHRLGYKSMHGLDARIAPADCGSCHQVKYCTDCHRRIK